MSKKKSILITGAAGFIGSNLSEYLVKNYNIIGIDNFDNFYPKNIKQKNLESLLSNSNFRFIEADILNLNQIQKFFGENEIDIIVHLAAKAGVRPSIENPIEYYNTNLNGTLNILKSAEKRNIKKIVFASSSSVYGNNIKTPFSESDNVDHPISPYAASKKAGELLCHTFHHLYGTKIACLRFFTVYGRRQRPDLAIAKFAGKILNNEKIQIYGDGSFSRDFTFIDDITDGIAKTITWLEKQNQPVYEIFNLGESQTYTVNQLVSEIENSLDKKANIEYLKEQQGDVKITYADISKAREILGYDPKTQLHEGIREYVNWIRNESGADKII